MLWLCLVRHMGLWHPLAGMPIPPACAHVYENVGEAHPNRIRSDHFSLVIVAALKWTLRPYFTACVWGGCAHAVHMQQAMCNMQRATCNMQRRATCNMQHEQHATCNKQHATCNEQHATCNEQHACAIYIFTWHRTMHMRDR